MYLEALLCYLPIGAMRIFGGGLICRQWSFFFSFYLSSLENYNLTLLVVGISTSVPIILISHFLF
jgi:hypothetical protein